MAFDPFLKVVQQKLTEQGYAPGPIDGYDGPKTRAAIMAFQTKHGLVRNGMVTASTWTALDDDAVLPERDIDPPAAEPVHVPATFPRQADVSRVYGNIGENLTTIKPPYPMHIAWDLKVPVKTIRLHEKVAESAKRVLERVADHYTPEQIADMGLNLFGGSFNPRKMRGGSRWSMHSWAIAIDFDPARNQLKWGRDRARLGKPDADKFWDLWEQEGWVGLGPVRNMDFMHVQAARL